MFNFDEYKNIDGTYTSPKNGKTYKSLKAFRSHWFNNSVNNFHIINSIKINCQFCNKFIGGSNIKRHESACYMNPVNLKRCLICNKPIKNYKSSKGTCGYSCSNKHFRTGENNGNWTQDSYRSTCFLYHKKECIVCKETNIVEVHHYDLNHNNNKPENLVPLCPTHHQYIHSKYRALIDNTVNSYIETFKGEKK